MLSDRDVVALRREVGRWAHPAGRALPWRSTRDPWAILVSEMMLQQTQVARVVPKFHAFLDRFPTVRACADAPAAAVIDAWSGLGFNRRAVALHRLARTVAARHDGTIPCHYDALRALPGVGPYTARAVLAFAYERDVAVVDTNVGRVLARLLNSRLTATQAQRVADRLVPPGGAWQWNQAMLDLGALLCVAGAPLCARCPVEAMCKWRGEGPDPAPGSARVSRPQSRFEGSDRQGRGRLLARLRAGPLAGSDLAAAAGWPGETERAQRAASTLVADGLARWEEGRLRLP